MRITYTEGIGIPIENLGDEEVEQLLALLAERKRKRADCRTFEQRRAGETLEDDAA